MNIQIYYFSGTGNSLKAAKDLASLFDTYTLERITHKNCDILQNPDSEIVGFFYPVYFSGLPNMMRAFIENLVVNPKTYYFAVSCFGGMDMASLNQINAILKKKGASLSSAFKILFPGNNQILYPVMAEEKQKTLLKNEEIQIQKIADIIKSKKTDLKALSNPLIKCMGNAMQKIAFRPKSKGNNFWVADKCIACGKCSKICPSENIEITNSKPAWKDKCELCLACMQWCPVEAIQYKKASLKNGRYQNPKININELF